jgi:hypothetical protein
MNDNHSTDRTHDAPLITKSNKSNKSMKNHARPHGDWRLSCRLCQRFALWSVGVKNFEIHFGHLTGGDLGLAWD